MKVKTISIVIPAYNEEESVKPLIEEVHSTISSLELDSFEIIIIDDGSSDKTFERLCSLKNEYSSLKIIKFRKNYGQTAAMDAGFKQAKYQVVIPLDADLQNDPKDIPKLLAKIEEGYDVVSGWRANRKDTKAKHFVSRGANFLRSVLLRDTTHDSGCTMKAYRKECFEDLNLFGEMHRFIPALLMWQGFKVTEVKTNHRSRKFGKTKYNFKRILKAFLDMLVVKFWMQYSTRPVHLFGGLGAILSLIGIIIGGYLTYLKIAFAASIGNRPLLLLSILCIILGIQFILFGIMSDILIKSYYKKDMPYKIKEIIE